MAGYVQRPPFVGMTGVHVDGGHAVVWLVSTVPVAFCCWVHEEYVKSFETHSLHAEEPLSFLTLFGSAIRWVLYFQYRFTGRQHIDGNAYASIRFLSRNSTISKNNEMLSHTQLRHSTSSHRFTQTTLSSSLFRKRPLILNKTNWLYYSCLYTTSTTNALPCGRRYMITRLERSRDRRWGRVS